MVSAMKMLRRSCETRLQHQLLLSEHLGIKDIVYANLKVCGSPKES